MKQQSENWFEYHNKIIAENELTQFQKMTEPWPQNFSGEELEMIAGAVEQNDPPIAPDEYDQDRDNKLTNN